MLSIDEATKIVQKNHPGEIQSHIEYKDLYLFMVFNYNPGEEEFDPFFSVDMNTGKFSEFSIMEDGNVSEIMSLFGKAKLGG